MSNGKTNSKNKIEKKQMVENPSQNEQDDSNSADNDYDVLSEQQTDSIKETGAVVTKGSHTVHCLTIIGQIEGHNVLPPQNKTTKYEHVIPQLMSIEEDDTIDGLLILLNTAGGDVEAGLAIAEVLAGMTKPTVSIVLGGGHSIGIPLAVAAKYSFIARSASMTVHPVRMTGLTVGVPQTFEYFQRMQDRITDFVCENSNISYDRYNQLAMNTGELVLDVGSILDGESAVDEGLIDEVGNVRDAMDCLYAMIESKCRKNTNHRHNSHSSRCSGSCRHHTK